ncbi:MAG: UTP--glucose-1-phosphate uridylyltransferase [Lachnospiraceae bacterium]|nr:UTP--glucose-1-phosphate uridylyltransferase [Lachnospiraceae bacterium]
MDYQEALKKLEKHGQAHLLRYYGELPAAGQEKLLAQIAATDFAVLDSLQGQPLHAARGVISPLAAMELAEIDKRRDEFTALGLEVIRQGKAGAVLLAGGMGTRLGSDQPKGMYNIGLTRPVYIFGRLMENLSDVVGQAGVSLPLYIMTSDKNHAATTAFFKEQNYFGYNQDYITFFQQEMAPATDYSGKVFLEGKDLVSTSPNGNGGWYASMIRGGVAGTAKKQGVEWLNVFAVDNVLQRMCDPVFIGATIAAGCVSGAKVVRKSARDEKVGAICLEDGRPSIVEYYDMTEELLTANDEKGDPAYNFGVILNYLFKVECLDAIIAKKLPLHIVEKKIPFLAADGQIVHPEAPNGYKYESLVLDMIHEMDSCLPFEVEREREFAPIKNLRGVDSVESARELCVKCGILL